MVGSIADHIIKLMRNQMGLMACLITCISLSACSNDPKDVEFFARKELPVQTIIDAHVDRSEYARPQVHLDAPAIVQFGNPNPRTEYPDGVNLWFYDDARQTKAFVRAGFAVTNDYTHITEVRDSVVIIDYRTGDTSYLKDLFWNSEEKRVYSNKPLRSVNGNRLTIGDGFESDENFDHPLIIRQRGVIEWKEEEEAQ